jgi:nitrite reductase (NADH) small subunit
MILLLLLQHLMRVRSPGSGRETDVAQWVRLCGAQEAPQPGTVMEAEVAGVAVCLANVDGRLAALDNLCPHRGGPLGGGWLDGEAVVCPWHCWEFSTTTGVAAEPERARVAVFPVRLEGEDVLVDLG